MASDLPGVFYRPDRGWSADVWSLVGSQFYGDEAMATWALDGVPPERLRPLALQLAGLVAVLLAHGPWGEGCDSPAELRERWQEATARIVAELEAFGVPDATPPDDETGP